MHHHVWYFSYLMINSYSLFARSGIYTKYKLKCLINVHFTCVQGRGTQRKITVFVEPVQMHFSHIISCGFPLYRHFVYPCKMHAMLNTHTAKQNRIRIN